MRKVRFVSILVLLALLLSAGAGAVSADDLPPVRNTPPLPRLDVEPDLDKPVSAWSDTDWERLVELIVGERITIPQSEVIVEQMTEEQIARVGELLAIRVGVPLDEWRRSIESNQDASQSPKITPQGLAPLSTGKIWIQPIEYDNLGYGAIPWYYSSSECGGDDDWVFAFLLFYAQDPDGLRWWTNSSQVYWAFLVRYGLRLNGFTYRWNEARLCVGKTGASLAGGPDYVEDHLFLRHQ